MPISHLLCLLLLATTSIPRSIAAKSRSGQRTFKFVNSANQDVWVGTWGSVNDCSTLYKLAGGGFLLKKGATQSYPVPNDWCSGRIWARTNCSTNKNGIFSCATGDCGNGVQCSTTGQPPATLAEFSLEIHATTTTDTYDMSLVDGYNVGMKIDAVNGKQVPGIPAKYNCGTIRCGSPSVPFKMSLCPKELRTQDGESCVSICQAVVSKNTQNPSYVAGFDRNLVCCECGCGPNCNCNDGKNPKCRYGCSPLHPTTPPFNYAWGGVCFVEQWPKSSTGLEYDKVFSNQCPDAYSWQFADRDSTYSCRGADYTITFFP